MADGEMARNPVHQKHATVNIRCEPRLLHISYTVCNCFFKEVSNILEFGVVVEVAKVHGPRQL